jgi:hypothetical protein
VGGWRPDRWLDWLAAWRAGGLAPPRELALASRVDPEVGDLQHAAVAQEQVAGLDVTVHDSLGVRVRQRRAGVPPDPGDQPRVQPGTAFAEVVPLQELH